MKSSKHGKDILHPEITNISEHGFWLFVGQKEYFLPFAQFPWFKKANVEQISDVQLLHKDHLFWPELDVDLSLNIIEQPQRYNLISR